MSKDILVIVHHGFESHPVVGVQEVETRSIAGGSLPENYGRLQRLRYSIFILLLVLG